MGDPPEPGTADRVDRRLSRVDPRTVLFGLLAIDLLIVVAYLATTFDVGDEPLVSRGGSVLDLDGRLSLPTWWQLTQLVVVAGLAVAAARRRGTGAAAARGWIAVALVAVVLGLEETVQVHERADGAIGEALALDHGWLAFAVVVAAAVAVIVLLVVAARFWLTLPARPRTILALGGACYVGGAIVLELVGDALWDRGTTGRGHVLAVAAEETLESIGLSLLVYGVLVALIRRPAPGGRPGRVEVDGRVVAAGRS